jgi:hypothetical protein
MTTITATPDYVAAIADLIQREMQDTGSDYWDNAPIMLPVEVDAYPRSFCLARYAEIDFALQDGPDYWISALIDIYAVNHGDGLINRDGSLYSWQEEHRWADAEAKAQFERLMQALAAQYAEYWREDEDDYDLQDHGDQPL